MLCWYKEVFKWFSHNRIIKIHIMPCLLYLLQVLSVKLPAWFLKDLSPQIYMGCKKSKTYESNTNSSRDKRGNQVSLPNEKEVTHLTRVVNTI